MPEEALTFTVCDAYRYFAGRTRAQLLRSQSRSRREYLIPANNIIVLHHFFNLTKKFNLNLLIRLDTFFNNLVEAYFFEPPCRWAH